MIEKSSKIGYNIYHDGFDSEIRGVCLLKSQGGTAMKVNSATIVFVLDLIGALALAASGVVAKHYISTTVVEV